MRAKPDLLAPEMREVMADALLAVVFGLSILVAFVAVSNQSFWIDEAGSGIYSLAPSPLAFAEDRGSTLQMPGYSLLLWVWANSVSMSEYGIRSLNLVFFIGAQAAFLFALKTLPLHRVFSAIAALASAFMWAYLDEARPYAMQFCGAALAAVAVCNAAFARAASVTDLILFLLGAVVLCVSSLLGVVHTFFLGLLYLGVLIAGGDFTRLLRSWRAWLGVLVAALVLLPTGIFYAWTLSVDAKASGVGATNVATLAFAVYELLGAGGYGPGRLALREVGVPALVSFFPLLAISLVPYLVAVVWILKSRRDLVLRPGWGLAFVGGYVASAFVAISLLGVFGEFRLVGRHFMPLAPFLFLGLGWTWATMWGDRSGRWLVVVSVMILFGGAGQQRVDSRFAKDDYRSAAAFARDALFNDRVVWWAADPAGARFYQVFPQVGSSETGHESIFFANNRDSAYLASLPAADVVVLSKTDIYDPSGSLREWMVNNGFTVTRKLPAFTVWERRGGN